MRNLCLLFLVGLATGIISEKLLVSSAATTDDLYLEGRTSGDFPVDDEDGGDANSGSGSGDFGFSDSTDKDEILKIFNSSKTSQPQTTAASPQNPATTGAAAADGKNPATTVKDSETTAAIVPDVDSKDDMDAVPAADPEATSVPDRETTATKFNVEVPVIKETGDGNSLDAFEVHTTVDTGDKDQVTANWNDIVPNDGKGSRIYDPVTSENMWERTEVLAAVIACGVVGFLCAVFLLILLAYRMKKKDEGSYDLGDTKLTSTSYHKAPTKEFYA